MLVNPSVDVGEGTVYRESREVSGSDVSLFCQEYYLNPRAVKKALELRVQYKYFLELWMWCNLRCSLLPSDAVASLSSEVTDNSSGSGQLRSESSLPKDGLVMQCLIKAYFKNICKLSSNGCYVPVNLLNEEGSNEGNIDVYLHEDSVLRLINSVHHWVLFKDIQLTDAIYIRDVVEVNPLEVARTIPRFYK